MYTGSDCVCCHNPSYRTFTVTFLSKQANSTENEIHLADDIVEGAKSFRLRLVAAQFIEQAATIFRALAWLTNTVADVTIEDNDCKFMNTPCITYYDYGRSKAGEKGSNKSTVTERESEVVEEFGVKSC